MEERNRVDDIEQRMHEMRGALEQIAGGDCLYICEPEDRPSPCPCDVCTAKRALRRADDWRYEGARAYRTRNGHNPRETRMILAWKNQVDDRRLAQILAEKEDDLTYPTVRDWFVASTVIQWLATNVGMGVLDAAGFQYTKWEEDRRTRDEQRAGHDREGT